MKKVGKPMVLRGRMTPNVNGHRINIFDGKYTTGYRILEFHVMPKSPTTESEIFAKIHTSSTSPSVGEVNMGIVSNWHGRPGELLTEAVNLLGNNRPRQYDNRGFVYVELFP